MACDPPGPERTTVPLPEGTPSVENATYDPVAAKSAVKAPTTATIPVALSGLQSQNGVQIAEVSAGVVLGVAPLLIASRFIQRYLVSGLTFGAIK